MDNLYLVQVVDSYGPNKFLPLAISYQWLNAQKNPKVSERWQCAGVLLEKLPISKWVKSLDNPSMIAMSCYVWNWNYNCKLAFEIKKYWKDCIICIGGPQVPKHDTEWIKDHPYFDIAILGENEQAFECILENPNPKYWSEINAIITHDYSSVSQPNRTKDLNIIPSPILSGFYNMIMTQYPKDTKWQVTWESMRGCPYHCAFCDIGDEYWNKAYWFDMNRIKKEIEWMGENKIEYVSVCDSNWGISERDKIITQWVIDTKLKTGYPKIWDVTWAKNNTQRVCEIAMMDKIAGTHLFKGITFALQSFNDNTLENVKRFNLTEDQISSSMKFFQKSDISTYSELIWPLPGESIDSFVNGLQKLIDIGQRDFLMVHPLVLTPNAPMGQKFYKNLHKIKSKNVPLDTFWLKTSDDYVIEKVDVVVSTNTANENDVISGHLISHWLIVLYYYGWGYLILNYLNKFHNIKHVDAILNLIEWIDNNTLSIFHKEHLITKNLLNDVFESSNFWGRQIDNMGEYWEYKSATSVIFHRNRQEVKENLSQWIRDSYQINDDELLDLNMLLCHDYKRTYPIKYTINSNLASLLMINEGLCNIEHYDSTIDDEDTFIHVAYHYQRKNRYWRCKITNLK